MDFSIFLGDFNVVENKFNDVIRECINESFEHIISRLRTIVVPNQNQTVAKWFRLIQCYEYCGVVWFFKSQIFKN